MVTVRSRSTHVLRLVVAVIVSSLVVSFSEGRHVGAWTTTVDTPAQSMSLLTGSDLDIGRSIAVGSDGSLYVLGDFTSPTLSAGALVVANAGATDVFVAKFDRRGDPVWLRSFGGPLNDFAGSLVVDASSGVYVGGEFANTATFSASPVVTRSASGLSDGFVARLDTGGALEWVAQVGGPTLRRDDVSNLAVTADGSVTVTAGGVDVRIEGLRPEPGGVLNVRPGESLTLTLSGLQAGSDVRVEMFSTLRRLWSGAADADGAVRAVVVVPRDREPGPHTLRVTGREAAGPVRAEVLVEVATLDDRLPATGVEVSLLLAVAVVAAGLVLVARSRRVTRW